MKRVALTHLFLAYFAAIASAGDWPMVGADAGRTGSTTEKLPAKLSLRWTYHAAHAPQPAWPRSDRQPFDRAYLPTVAGGILAFGSSADGKLYALDAATGAERWTFFSGGPIRFAPAFWRDRVFVVSDDGCLYCLAANDGKLLWLRRGGPETASQMILGNDRIVSAWPARGGPVIVDGVVYFGAGIWPSDGIYLYALDAQSGKTLWVNDDAGGIFMAQPHGGANAASGVSAQGYLTAQGDQLLVPTGRAVPAVFNRTDGKFQYFHLQANGQRGGTGLMATDSFFFNSGALFETAKGSLLETLDAVKGGTVFARWNAGIVHSRANEVVALEFVDKVKKDNKGNIIAYKGMQKLWSVPQVPGGSAVIVAGDTIICGGPNRVTAVDATTKNAVWSVEVSGIPYGLAAADGRLYVSTDKGVIYCFAAVSSDRAKVIKNEPQQDPYGDNATMAAAAREIIEKSGFTEGYCVDLGCGDGALAYELARQTKLHIIAIDADPTKVALARQRLAAAGLYGVRVTVHQGDPAKTPYPKNFANLVVSGRSVGEGAQAVSAEEAGRLQRPYGGVICLGKTGATDKKVRGAMAGAGNWTHQYADAANTSFSPDSAVKGPLGMLWFRDCDLQVPDREGVGPAPLLFDGRMFVLTVHALRAVDAYNGRTIWEAPLKDILKDYDAHHWYGVAGTGSLICVSADGVYVRMANKCLRFDLATGRILNEIEAPPRPDGSTGFWGYLACENGLLYGSLAHEKHKVPSPYGFGDMSRLFPESNFFFALDAVTGKVKWTYTPDNAIRHNAIAIGDGSVYLIDRASAKMDRIKRDPQFATKIRLGGIFSSPPLGTGVVSAAAFAAMKNLDETHFLPHSFGKLRVFDAATGQRKWQANEDTFGTMLVLSAPHKVLLVGYQKTTAPTTPSEVGGRLAALQSTDGKRLWDLNVNLGTRPLINDSTIYANAGAWDLRTGKRLKFELKRSYGCGQLSGSCHLLVYRSATLGYYDLTRDYGTENYGGLRPGCWINAIPAGGLVLVPDGSSGCNCSYLNQAWLALQPKQ